MKNLIIVESPAKAKTIEKFLGKDYTVMSSHGHIRDLRKKDFSIDVKDDFQPDYVISDDKKEIVRHLKAAAAKADMVWLASDEDREGEAIAWHLYEVLGLKPENTRRIVFHEITKPAIVHAIENPRDIDIDRVNAQQARRVLDRIVGFELSPVLWKKIKPALSAGRVQSVAVRLICEREKEIRDFHSEPFYRVNAHFLAGNAPLKAELNRRLQSEEESRNFLEYCKNAAFEVENISVKPVTRAPQPPFTTSTLQQEAARRLGFSVAQTMATAQRLYEAGHITYMRTDSVNLSQLALNDMAKEITSSYGKEYLHTRQYHTNSKGAQEAHEAIRPTYIGKTSIEGDSAEQRLYQLIRRRALASQMENARLERTNVDIRINSNSKALTANNDFVSLLFKAEGEVVKFEGFMKVYETDSTVQGESLLPPLKENESLTPTEITATERFTLAPPRYSEATLVKKMEDLGIGRPSTYAPTISTIQTREYVRKGEKEGEPRDYIKLTLSGDKISKSTLTENTGSDKRKLVPTDIGMIVNDFLTEHFPDILDYNFTARVEEKFDEISEGKLPWKKEISDFYGGFHPSIEKINNLHLEHKVGQRELGVDPKTGRNVSVKIGRFGPVVQIGDAGDEEKPLFARLPEDKSVATITLEEALKLFELPRTVGEFEGTPVVASTGRFGPYLHFQNGFISIPKGLDPKTITLEEATEIILNKRAEDAQRIIRDYTELPGLQLLKGRYGPYLAYKPEGSKKAVNYKLPKGTDVENLSFEEALKIKEAQDAAPARPARRTTTRRTKK